jgi:hypothetical protein
MEEEIEAPQEALEADEVEDEDGLGDALSRWNCPTQDACPFCTHIDTAC